MDSITEIQNDKIKTTLLKVEALQKEYEVTLQQYQEAGKTYITSLQTDSPNFIALKGRTWWGTTGLSEGTVSSQEECENMCSNSNECSGATFNPVKHYCWTRKGDSTITVGLDDDYALLTKQKESLSAMTRLNEKILDLNTQISNELTNINPQVEAQNKEKILKQQQLNTSYKQLLEQKIEMEKQLQEYYSLEQEEDNQSIYANQQNVSLRFWVLITCLILLITIKRMFGLSSFSASIIFWILIFIVVLILTYNLNSPSGFITMLIVLFSIGLMLSGILPTP